MAGKIFINYRRDDSSGTAGRLYDRLTQTFGRERLFMDVDHIPAGVDFVTYLNTQVGACDIFLAIIGPDWLNAKDHYGRRRLGNPDDFVSVEIATALVRNIRVIPVLVDGAHIPTADELPESIKPLARRNAIEVRNAHFGRDAEVLVDEVREGLQSPHKWSRFLASAAALLRRLGRWRVVGGGVAGILLGGWIALYQMGPLPWVAWALSTNQPADGQAGQQQLKEEQEHQARVAADAEAKRKAAAEAEQQRLTAIKEEEQRRAKAADVEAKLKAAEAEQQRLREAVQRQAKAAADAEAKLKAAEADQQRLAAAKADAERKAEAEARRKNEEAERQRRAALRAEEERRKQAEVERLAGSPAAANVVCTNGQCATCDGPSSCSNGTCVCNRVLVTGRNTQFQQGPCGGQVTMIHDNGGGRVASTASVDQSVYVSRDSAVCGRAIVFGSTRLINGSVVNGQADVHGHSTLTGSTVNGGTVSDSAITQSTLNGNARVLRSELAHSTLNGTPVVEDSTVVGSVLNGSASVVGRRVQGMVLNGSHAP
jgi:hypothetical protein